ncbi:MAG: ERF family protein [Rhodothermales bacterium]|nr:ERF family protein [Rhodothermales bacterium]
MLDSFGNELAELQSVLINQAAPEPTHDKLFAALAKAQGEIKNAEHDAEADAGQYKYKYATLDSVLNAIRGPLSKNGLSIIQLPGRKIERDNVEILTLTTVLGHTSGQSIENYFEMYPPKRDPQGIGSAMTYMRRYTLMAICGIAGAADKDAEDLKEVIETISADQADQIYNLADELFGADADELLKRMCDKIFQVDAVADIPAKEFEVAIRRIENTRKRKDREKERKLAEQEGTPPAKPPAEDKAPQPKGDDDEVPTA